MAETDVQRLLDLHKSLVLDEKTQKIKCSLTNHEMPAKASAIESYVSGKKYKRLADLNTFLYGDHKEHIVQNKKKENELFCNLTLHHLEKTAQAIQRHINGRKYKNALARWKECQKTGTKFTPKIQRKAKGPNQSDDDKEDDKADDGNDDEDDVASDGTVVEDGSSDDEDDVDEEEDDDDMSDLYPAADFEELSDEDEDGDEKENEEEDDEEDEEEEEEEKDNTKNKKTVESKKTKRTKTMNGHGGSAKKQKIKKPKS